MADYGTRVVGQESGNPHYMGQSIWDLMRPNPQGEEDIQQNLYGAGAIGQDEPTNITEGRSPFGQMLQGIGLLGPPSPRALTPFEQFQYQRGLHQKGEWDQQTQQQSLENISRKFGLAGQVMKQTGGAALPPEVANLFSPDEQNSLSTAGEHFGRMQLLSDQIKEASLANIQAETQDRLKRLTQDNADREEARQQMINQRRWSNPLIQRTVAEYDALQKQEDNELLAGSLTPDKRSNYASLRNQLKTKIKNAGNVLGIPQQQLDALGDEEDPFAATVGPKTGPNQNNLVNDAMGVNNTLKNMGINITP